MPTSICTIRFQIRTILFAFRRVRVCVCFLVSHPCETMGTHAKASLPCLPLPLHRPTPFPQPLQKDNTPTPRTTTLASLVKGEVLSPDKTRATTGGIATPPSSPRTNHSKTALSHSLFVMPTSVCADMLSHPHYPIRFS